MVARRRTLYAPETGDPAELGASYLPLEIAAGTYLEEANVVPKALFLCVEEITGRRYAKARERFTARMPSIDEATTLRIGPGNPVIHVIHAAFDEHDQILEVSESVWPADRVMIVDEYDIPAEAVALPMPSDV